MNKLETHLERLTDWVKTLDGYSNEWTSILIVEDPLFTLRTKNWEIQKDLLNTVSEYKTRFSELLTKGYSWININFGGIYQGNAIIFIEYPRESSGIPNDKVSINMSGPEGNEWDLNKKLTIKY